MRLGALKSHDGILGPLIINRYSPELADKGRICDAPSERRCLVLIGLKCDSMDACLVEAYGKNLQEIRRRVYQERFAK